MMAVLDIEVRARVDIRPATVEDVPAVAVMMLHFAETGEYRSKVTLEHLTRVAAQFQEIGLLFVAVHSGQHVGMIMGLVYDHFLTNIRLASESVWWVEPSARGSHVAKDLLTAFEEAAKDHGAEEIEIGSRNARLDRYYERLGYAAIERTFRKVVTW